LKKSNISISSISTRDLIIVLVLLAGLIFLGWWTLLYTKITEETVAKEAELKGLQEERTRRENVDKEVARLEDMKKALPPQIDAIAEWYLPENTVQFYYDKLNDHVAALYNVPDPEVGIMLTTSVETMPVSSNTARDSDSGRVEENALTSAIGDYAKAAEDDAAKEAAPAAPEEGEGEGEGEEEWEPVIKVGADARYSFRYIPIRYNLTGGNFATIQEFVKSLNLLDWSMYFAEARIENNDKGTLNASFQIYFISIDKLESTKEAEKYVDFPGPAGEKDLFHYHAAEENE